MLEPGGPGRNVGGGTPLGIALGAASDQLRLTPAYAGAADRGTRRDRDGLFMARSHRLCFGVLGLLALLLPYGGLFTAAVKSIVDPPNMMVGVPDVLVTVPRLPVLATPGLPATAVRDRPGSSTGSGASRRVARSAVSGARSIQGRPSRTASTRSRMTTGTRQVPTIRSGHSLTARPAQGRPAVWPGHSRPPPWSPTPPRRSAPHHRSRRSRPAPLQFRWRRRSAW
jgi:hypothetical protein